MTTQNRMSALGLQFPTVMLPIPEVDLQRWAVIACDQFTSDQAYWDSVEEFVGSSPSTLRLVLPEIYLETGDPSAEQARIRGTMKQYLDQGLLQEFPESAVYVRRTLSDGVVRKGLVVAVDLESYDFHPETKALIRASEETIPSRLPPRAAIRSEALLETPHVLVLYNDTDNTVMKPLDHRSDSLELLYDTPLMMGGGSVVGRRLLLNDPVTEEVVAALEALRRGTLLFAMGDGNHSLAAARTVWDKRKAAGAPDDDPFRYCLVELVNVFDPGLPFHPIHRVAKGNASALLSRLKDRTGGVWTPLSRESFLHEPRANRPGSRDIAFYAPDTAGILTVSTDVSLPVEAVDDALAGSDVTDIDYVHGFEEVCRAADRTGGIALIVPEFDRDKLFPTVAAQGTLPRKAFSLGRSTDKRYYLECRALT